MITIMPADKAFLEEIHAPAGVEAMVLRDADGTVEGHALFRMADKETVEILRAECPLPMMTEALVRSVLNAGDCRGAKDGVCRIEALAPILRALEFQKKQEEWRISIDAFFRAPCPSEKQDHS